MGNHDVPFPTLLLNAALLIAMVQAISLPSWGDPSSLSAPKRVLLGLVVGAVGVAVMLAPWVVLPGVVVDARNVLLAIAGLYLGAVPTWVAVAVVALFRFGTGGVAMTPGIAGAVLAAAAGLAWRRHRKHDLWRVSALELFGLGLAVHAVLFGLIALLPAATARSIAEHAAVPALLVLPALTVATGKLLSSQLRSRLQDQQLRDSEARYHALFNNEHTIMLVADGETGAILDANPAAARYYGWSVAQLKAMHVTDINGASREAMQARFGEIRDAGFHRVEVQHRRADGSRGDVEVFAGPVRIAGKPAVLTIVHDISARKKVQTLLEASEQRRQEEHAAALAEQHAAQVAALNLMTDAVDARRRAEQALEDLRETDRRLQLALRAGRQGIYVWHRSSDVIEITPDFAELVGMNATKVFANDAEVWSRVHRDDLEALRNTMAEARFDDSGQRHLEFRYRLDDATWLWLSATATVQQRNPDGTPRRVLGTLTDITEAKRRDNELDEYRQDLEKLVRARTAELTAARQQAEAASKAKSAFLANMSHEFRTPLNAIVGMTHLLLRESPTPPQVDRLEKIAHASKQLLSIVNDVLDVAQLDGELMRLSKRDFDLVALLQGAAAEVRPAAAAKRLTLRCDIGEVPRIVCGDADRLRQALGNYLSNAVKFTDAGEILLRAALVEAAGPRGALVRFEVRDTGIGMTAELAQRVFGAFEQADTSTTRRHGGAGVGLALTRRIAERMGGEAGVDSVLGQGSCFWFTARLAPGRVSEIVGPLVGAALGAAVAERSGLTVARQLRRLGQLPGMAVADGIARMRGDEARYLETLRSFVRHQGVEMQALRALLAEARWLDASQICHRLKGAASTLGAVTLAHAAAQLERATRAAAKAEAAPPQAQDEVAAVEQALAPLEALLSNEGPEPQAGGGGDLDAAGLLDALAVLVRDSDASAVALVQDHAAALVAAYGDAGQRLVDAVQRFAFEAAQVELAAITAAAAAAPPAAAANGPEEP